MSEKCFAKYPYPNAFPINCEREKGHDGVHLYRSFGELFEWNDEPTPPPLGVSVEEKVDTKDKPG